MTRKTLTSVLAAALVVSGLASASVQAADTTILKRMPTSNLVVKPALNNSNRAVVATGPVMKLKLKFNCASRGSPVEFPNDIAIWHDYNFTVAAGTKVAYVAAFGNSGVATLPAIAPGKQVFIANVVPGGVSAETPCTATQM